MTAQDNVSGFLAFPLWQEVLLTALTDVRGSFENPINNPDTIAITVAAGLQDFTVLDVYDVGKGFTNEYRVAVVMHKSPRLTPVP